MAVPPIIQLPKSPIEIWFQNLSLVNSFLEIPKDWAFREQGVIGGEAIGLPSNMHFLFI